MGSVVKQTGEQFGEVRRRSSPGRPRREQGVLREGAPEFIEFAVKVLKSNRVIEKAPTAKEMVDLRFL